MQVKILHQHNCDLIRVTSCVLFVQNKQENFLPEHRSSFFKNMGAAHCFINNCKTLQNISNRDKHTVWVRISTAFNAQEITKLFGLKVPCSWRSLFNRRLSYLIVKTHLNSLKPDLKRTFLFSCQSAIRFKHEQKPVFSCTNVQLTFDTL